MSEKTYDKQPENLLDLLAKRHSDHAHCWHMHRGPIWAVIPDGHVVQKCCKCPHTRTIHRDHMFDGGHGSLDARGGDWWRGRGRQKPSLSVTSFDSSESHVGW